VRHLAKNWAWYCFPPALAGTMFLAVLKALQGDALGWIFVIPNVFMAILYIWALRVNLTAPGQKKASVAIASKTL